MNAAVNPGAAEVSCDSIDNDCDAATEDNPPDSDGDGIGYCNDQCPNDPDDVDGDGICGDVDTCPNDPDNDVDG